MISATMKKSETRNNNYGDPEKISSFPLPDFLQKPFPQENLCGNGFFCLRKVYQICG